ncbi:MAG TPA: acyloxyacyl hydrolase [Casimicrobiaceae bacterium]|nr:acyloxyacyl hydrolase [Casimicrobiaceae bacterium]
MKQVFAAWLVGLWVVGASPAARADPEVQALAIASAVVVVATIAEPPLDGPDEIAFEAGGFDVVKNVQPAAAFGLEYRIGKSLLWKLRPFVGAGVTTQGSFYGYGGIRVATYWGERLVITPSFAVGGYGHGSGKDLGDPPVIGRFGIDVEYRLDNDMRVGIAYHHISNGKVLGQSTNPGTEVIGLTLSVALQ